MHLSFLDRPTQPSNTTIVSLIITALVRFEQISRLILTYVTAYTGWSSVVEFKIAL